MNIFLKIILHLFFWVVFLGISAGNSYPIADRYLFWGQLILASLWAGTAFYSFYFFIYRFIEKHRFLRYFVYSILGTVVICIPFIVISRYFLYTGKYSLGLLGYSPIVIVTYIIANCGSLLRGFINWIENSKQKAEMEKRNLQLELEALRSQVNPHFLFNTLNNIDSLILSQPQKASTMIITLSEVMRYMLYQTKNAKVTLEMENKHLENVLVLHRIRFAQSNYIQFDCSISQPERTIAPLLFLPFVENACKFAQFKQTLPVIVISLHQTENTVTFTCKNNFDAKAVTSTENGGIGLENVKKRLQLLYPKNHSLKIEDDGTCFFVILVVNLL